MKNSREWKRATFKACAISLALLAAGCAGNAATSLPPIESTPMSSYRLDAGDKIRVVVFGQDNIPTEYTLDDNGNISFPLASQVAAKGMTTEQLEANLLKRLEGVLVQPSVSVQLVESRPFYVVGGVNKPGSFRYVRNMTVLSAVAMAEGFTEGAYDDYVKVSRIGTNGQVKDWRAGHEAYVRPDDIIYVYEKY